MSKQLNIIQRRELEPILHKADIIAKHYEKIANCAVSVLRPECSAESNQFNFACRHCKGEIDENGNKICALMHIEAVQKAKELGGSYIYACNNGLIFWISPFYSGERYAGALLSGGMFIRAKSSNKVKALANIMMICADQISGMSFIQKNITPILENNGTFIKEKKVPQKDEKIKAFSLDMERMLISHLKRGDIQEARILLFKLLKILYHEVNASFAAFRLKALELSVLIFRALANPNDINDNTVIEASSLYQKKINNSSSIEEIKEILTEISEKMAERLFSFHGVRHFPALRKAERFIWENYSNKISLRDIAKVSGLSAPYFSTIFRDEMGENLSDYLNRLRVEKAAALLLTTNMTIGEIAKACGFEDQSWFSKIFKINTGYTPGKYRDQGSITGLSA